MPAFGDKVRTENRKNESDIIEEKIKKYSSDHSVFSYTSKPMDRIDENPDERDESFDHMNQS